MAGVKSVFKQDPRATAATGLVTSGAGIFYGLSVTNTAVLGTAQYVSVYDASAVSSSIYSYSSQSLPTAANRLLWVQQVNAGGSTDGSRPAVPMNPPVGIHFFHGLVVGMTNFTGTAGAATALGVCATYRNGFPSNTINA